MKGFPILSILLFLPIVGIGFMTLFAYYPKLYYIFSKSISDEHKKEKDIHLYDQKISDTEFQIINLKRSNIFKYIALTFTLLEFVLSLVLWHYYDAANPDMQFIEQHNWMSFETWNNEEYDHQIETQISDISYSLGVDGISIFFVLLTTFLMPICILSSWSSINKRVKDYMMLFLALESLVIGSFLATDLILFFLFFESVLIPMFLIIGIWGGENRVYAALKFFLYTFFGSVFMFIAVIYIYFNFGTSNILNLTAIIPRECDLNLQKWLWLAFFLSFAVKVPMFPFHTWLPDAHVQAPTGGSVILAGVLLKLGGYGFLRFSLPIFPLASIYFSNFVLILSSIAVIYTSLVALMQKDMKKLIAYSSIAHMGMVTAGIFVFNTQGIEGAIFQMISHGLVSAALFLCVGILYDRMHTKEIAFYSGLTNYMPQYARIFMLMTLASIGLPATSGFIGEFLIILAVFQQHQYCSAFLATGMVLGAAYMLWLYGRVMFGKTLNPALEGITDICTRENIIFVPIALLIVLLGIYPSIVIENISSTVNLLKDTVQLGQLMWE